MIHQLYIAGVHSSRKGELAEHVARELGWRAVPRLPRTELLDEALVARLQMGDQSAVRVLHERVHKRYRDSIDEWCIHRRLATQDADICLSDRSPLDVQCYHRALLRLGWLDDRACEECEDYRARVLKAAWNSCGLFLDPETSILAEEFEARKMNNLRPLEHQSGYLKVAAAEFRRTYSQIIEDTGRWIRIRRADPEQAMATLLIIAGTNARDPDMI